MLLLLRPGVGRRRAGSSLASTTPSSALCGPPSGIRLRPGVGRRRAGSSLASTTPSSALCGPPSGIRSPGGIGHNDKGDFFYTDNQGVWNGSSSLKWLRPGSFQGNPTGNKSAPLLNFPAPPERAAGAGRAKQQQQVW